MRHYQNKASFYLYQRELNFLFSCNLIVDYILHNIRFCPDRLSISNLLFSKFLVMASDLSHILSECMSVLIITVIIILKNSLAVDLFVMIIVVRDKH